MRKLRLEELNRLSISDYKESSKLAVTVVLDNIRSAHNVGSIFRTVDGLGIQQIYLCGITARPPHKEINKSAIGATNSVSWEYHEDISDILTTLKSDHCLIGIEQTTESKELTKFDFPKSEKLVLIFGNEVDGISENILPLLDHSLELAQFGTKHSFNVAVCAGMVLWETARQLRS